MDNLWLGLISGVLFGFVIQRGGATDADEMVKAHLMADGRVPKFMVAAVALSALGLYGLQSVGVGRVMVLPVSIVATGLGAVIFGIGWGLSGYCPGTCWAAAGEGRMDAIFALLGGFVGTLLFAQLHETLIPLLYLPTSMGPVTLTDWLGEPGGVLTLFVVFAVMVWLIGRLWGTPAEE
ncbi:MAG: hypothetical protein C0609_00355 [Deltaproteobacteria bacterium]|nr:MAG: hypothetical protein C0609_00355 [Deltaproteobacteria bacterium]